MTNKWVKIEPSGETTVLPVDAEPDLKTLQEAVGGLIEYAPDFYVRGDISIGFTDTDLFGTEIKLSGKVKNIIMNEESKLPFLSLTTDEERDEYLKANLNPITQLFQPHDFVLGNVVVELEMRESGFSDSCLDCENLPAEHPDWMKGMCENCYEAWAKAISDSFGSKDKGD